MAKDCSSGRRDRAAGVKSRCSMKTATAMTSDSTVAQVHWQCLLVMVAGARTGISPTWCWYLWRSFHRACGISEGGRNWDGWMGGVVVVVVVLKVVAVLLETACMWVSKSMVILGGPSAW